MATLSERVKALATQIGIDIKKITIQIGQLTDLATEEKTNLVGAINELHTELDDIIQIARNSSEIDDGTPKANKTYSSQKVAELLKAVHDILGAGIPDTEYQTVIQAINTFKSKIAALEAKQIDLTELIDDSAAHTNKVYSSSKTDEKIEAAKTALNDAISQAKIAVKAEILDGAPDALNTLKELADALNGDASFAAKTAEALNKRVRYDATQSLSTEEKNQACNNIGVGEPDTDFVAAYNQAKTQD